MLVGHTDDTFAMTFGRPSGGGVVRWGMRMRR